LLDANMKEKDTLKNNLRSALTSLANNIASNLKDKFTNVKDKNVLVEKIDNADRNLLISISNSLKNNNHNYLLVTFSKDAIYISTDIKEIHAGNLMKEICSLVGGSGGGKPTEANGKITGNVDINKVKELVSSKI